MKLLIVEDTKAIAEWLADAVSLTSGGTVDVSTVTTDFRELVTPAPWEGVDVALVDIMLPDISGLVILKYLAQHHPKIKAICMTASIPSAADALGSADQILVKPFSLADLYQAIGLNQ